MDLRAQLEALGSAGDLAVIEEHLAAAPEPFAVAAEAARTNGPALLFEDVPGEGRLVAGTGGGPDRTVPREQFPRSRVAEALGLSRTVSYSAMLETIVGAGRESETPQSGNLAGDLRDVSLPSLGLPRVDSSSRPLVTSGILAVEEDGATRWAPVRGTVHDRETVHVTVPETVAVAAAGEPVRVAMGVPTAALLAAHVTARGGYHRWSGTGPAIAGCLADIEVADADGPAVPASSEVVVGASATRSGAVLPGPRARWEAAVETATLELTVGTVATRADPLVPVVPVGEPLADDVHLAGLVEAAQLYARVNDYWGVSPVEWVNLPVEAGLGICLVASEILYAGFEWQLANTLFSYTSLFDKVFIFDADRSADDLGRAFDDIWVKAHPSRDWTFSEPEAPAPTATGYRQDGTTGERLHVNAAWDPGWDEEYIAPEVGFETTYSREMQAAVLDRWEEFGFEAEED